MSLFTETVVLRRRGSSPGRDGYGNPIPGPVTSTPVPAWFEPRESGESTDAQNQVVSGYWVALEGHPELDSLEAVEILGDDYEVDGEPGRVPGGYVVKPHTKVAVKRVTG